MSKVGERATQLQEEYSRELDGFVDERIPASLDNEEYFARLAALMVAQNRSMARLAATFAVQTQRPLVSVHIEHCTQLGENMELCARLLNGQASTIQ